MRIRTPIEPDAFENFLIKRTEATVNTAFLWLLILKGLNTQPQTAAQLRKQLIRKHSNPHKATLYTSIYLLQTMKLIERTDDTKEKIYQVTPKGKEILERATKHLHSNLAVILG